MPLQEKLPLRRRAIVIIVDGCGIGAASDAHAFGDLPTCNTLANTAQAVGGLNLPTLAKLGLGNISPIRGVPAEEHCLGLYGKLQERSNGKDTQTGHWEMMGIISPEAFPLYPDGFPADVIQEFIHETGCKNVLCNKPASGTVVLGELGEEHERTGFPIVYTSGDSVFQIACHVETIPLAKQYSWCEAARIILQGQHRVGRVIARPFTGSPGHYVRLSGDRRDYAVPPPSETFLDMLLKTGMGVLGIGKIEDIFVGQGLSHARHTGGNKEGLELTLQAVSDKLALNDLSTGKDMPEHVQLIFTNLVDTDSLYGHRRDVKGYATALEGIDQGLSRIMATMHPEDLLIISSDHGNDPTAVGTDHTREFVPLLAYSPSFEKHGIHKTLSESHQFKIGTRDGFVDIAATLADWLEIKWNGPGVSFLPNKVVGQTNRTSFI